MLAVLYLSFFWLLISEIRSHWLKLTRWDLLERFQGISWFLIDSSKLRMGRNEAAPRPIAADVFGPSLQDTVATVI